MFFPLEQWAESRYKPREFKRLFKFSTGLVSEEGADRVRDREFGEYFGEFGFLSSAIDRNTQGEEGRVILFWFLRKEWVGYCTHTLPREERRRDLKEREL